MKQILLTSLLILSFQSVSLAQDISVESFEFGLDVQDREIVNPDTVFSSDVERVFCLTHITNMEGESTVTHNWYLNNEEMDSVELPVRSSNWRTWSSKTILPEWTGEWRVDVRDSAGNLLMSKSFTVDDSGL